MRTTHINPNQIKAEKSEGGDGVSADGTKAFSNLPSFVRRAAPLKYRKHRKNCKCCPCHTLFKGHKVIVYIVVLIESNVISALCVKPLGNLAFQGFARMNPSAPIFPTQNYFR